MTQTDDGTRASSITNNENIKTSKALSPSVTLFRCKSDRSEREQY